MHIHKVHSEQLQMLMMVVYYVLNRMHSQLVLVMNYKTVGMLIDLQFLVEHRQQQLLLNKHRQ
jgi:hypothetical protein